MNDQLGNELDLEQFDEEVQVVATILEAYLSRGGSLKGFVSNVLPYAIRLQELREQRFKGKVIVNVSTEGEIKHCEEWFGTADELCKKYGIN